MKISGKDHPAPPKLARQLKERIAELLTRHSFEEVMHEIARQKKNVDIYICPAGGQPV